MSRFGVPSTVINDRGAQLQSHPWQEHTRLLGTNHIRTTAYHPIANEIIERFHRQLKASLKVKSNSNTWNDCLPMVLHGIRSSYNEDFQGCSAELVYGTTFWLLGQFFDPSSRNENRPTLDFVRQIKANMENPKATPTKSHAFPIYMNKKFNFCTHVFVRHIHVQKPLDVRDQ